MLNTELASVRPSTFPKKITELYTFKWVNYMAHELNPNKAVFKNAMSNSSF